MKFLLVYSLLFNFLLFPLTVSAQVYKWVDEHGDIQYSDKKPEKGNALLTVPKGESAIARSEKFDWKQRPARRQGIINPNKDSKDLLIVAPEKLWKNIKKGAVVGEYFHGKYCSAFRDKVWPQAHNEHASHFLGGSNWAYYQGQVTKSLGYRYRISNEYNEVGLKKKLGAYSLRSELLAFYYDSCVPNFNRSVYSRYKNVGSSSFKRHRVYVKVHWKLIGGSGGETLFENDTEGYADNWDIDSSGMSTFGQAVEDATRHLFSNVAFTDHLLIAKVADRKERNFLDEVRSFLGSRGGAAGQQTSSSVSVESQSQQWSVVSSYKKKAYFAQAVAELGQFKVLLSEYYLSRGNWPADLGHLGVPESVFTNSKVISEVSIQPDGSMLAYLREVFGDRKLLILTPDTSSGLSISWKCSSNMSPGVMPEACEEI